MRFMGFNFESNLQRPQHIIIKLCLIAILSLSMVMAGSLHSVRANGATFIDAKAYIAGNSRLSSTWKCDPPAAPCHLPADTNLCNPDPANPSRKDTPPNVVVTASVRLNAGPFGGDTMKGAGNAHIQDVAGSVSDFTWGS